ncbi:MAG TPA: M23 family metallopeptidase [Candidatus Kapabacteria bacterium]|nr:M23 family metallopeptidase [Candidatus Kapabacteria bacterium]
MKSSDRERRPETKPVAPLALQWPVSGRKIVDAYGERLNPTTKTVTLNPGVNIASKKGADVRAAAAGRVSLVSFLPGFGTFVIVEHRDGYRTVYARLSRASVATGASVRAGASIGAAAGATVHFEVWRGQSRLDPADLLP